MKWSYTNGKLNVSSDELDQQFTLKELIAEASRHQAYRKKILALFGLLTASLFLMQSYGGDIPRDASVYFYIGYFATPSNYCRLNFFNNLLFNEKTTQAS